MDGGRERSGAEDRERSYCDLMDTMEKAQWLDDTEKSAVREFLRTLVDSDFYSFVEYGQDPNVVNVRLYHRDLRALINYKVNPSDANTEENKPLALTDEWLTETIRDNFIRELYKTLDTDPPEFLKKKTISARYKIFYEGQEDAPMVCGNKDTRYIMEQLHCIVYGRTRYGEWRKGKQWTREEFMEENIKEALPRHYKGQEKIIDSFVKNFHSVSWSFYDIVYHKDIPSIELKLEFPSYSLNINRRLDLPITKPISLSLEERGNTILLGESDEDLLANHINDGITGILRIVQNQNEGTQR